MVTQINLENLAHRLHDLGLENVEITRTTHSMTADHVPAK